MVGLADEKRCFVLAITISYLHWAAVVAQTIARWESDTPVLVFVTDIKQEVLDSHSWPVGGNVTLIGGDRLIKPGFAEARQYFNGLEMSGPSKIYGLEYALLDAGYDKAIFLDADIHVTGDFSTVWRELDTACSVVTPHVCSPLPEDGQSPDNLEIASYGLVNGGFWGLSKKPELAGIIAFMKQQVLHFGFFLPGPMSWAAEQTWMSVLPFMFPDANRILRSPGLNVAYWNLHERHLDGLGGKATSNGEPLIFLHLSGFKPQARDRLTVFDVRAPSEANFQYLRPVLAAQADALDDTKSQMPSVVPDFPCSTAGIWGRLHSYKLVHGRDHQFTWRILLASLAYTGSNVVMRIKARVLGR